eukprot:7378853-Prymnesium_polylepis.2
MHGTPRHISLSSFHERLNAISEHMAATLSMRRSPFFELTACSSLLAVPSAVDSGRFDSRGSMSNGAPLTTPLIVPADQLAPRA